MLKRKKHDEMDNEIRSKSIITAHYYTQLMLVVWIIIYTLKHKLVLMPLYIFMVGLLVRGVSALIYRHDFGDERWKKGLVILISSIAAIVLLLALSVGIPVEGV